VSIVVYDVRGAVVRRLVNRPFEKGEHTIAWDGTNDRGLPVAAGVYFYRMRAGDFVETRKMVLLK
jgi:flagellar hook assembly protein FlgD